MKTEAIELCLSSTKCDYPSVAAARAELAALVDEVSHAKGNANKADEWCREAGRLGTALADAEWEREDFRKRMETFRESYLANRDALARVTAERDAMRPVVEAARRHCFEDAMDGELFSALKKYEAAQAGKGVEG